LTMSSANFIMLKQIWQKLHQGPAFAKASVGKQAKLFYIMNQQNQITNRQAKILAAIIKEYSTTGLPVGSGELSEKYGFSVSAATIRNEMQALEKAGYIFQPHTSAGRVPTDAGFRFFVNKLMKHLELTQIEQQRLQQELKTLQKQYIELGKSLTKLLAKQAQGAAFALLPGNASVTGLSNVIDSSVSTEEVREIAKFLEDVSEYGGQLVKTDEVKAYIGSEAPVPLAKDFSLVVTKVNLPHGEKGVIGIIGPKRMKYARNISLLEYVKKLLATGLSAIIIVSIPQLTQFPS